MAETLTLARKAAPTPSLFPADITLPPSVHQHVQAARLSLEKALQALSVGPQELQIATGRAIRAATLLKRACKALDATRISQGA